MACGLASRPACTHTHTVPTLVQTTVNKIFFPKKNPSSSSLFLTVDHFCAPWVSVCVCMKMIVMVSKCMCAFYSLGIERREYACANAHLITPFPCLLSIILRFLPCPERGGMYNAIILGAYTFQPPIHKFNYVLECLWSMHSILFSQLTLLVQSYPWELGKSIDLYIR